MINTAVDPVLLGNARSHQMLHLKHMVKMACVMARQTWTSAVRRLTALFRTELIALIECIDNVQFHPEYTARCGEVDLPSPRDISTT